MGIALILVGYYTETSSSVVKAGYMAGGSIGLIIALILIYVFFGGGNPLAGVSNPFKDAGLGDNSKSVGVIVVISVIVLALFFIPAFGMSSTITIAMGSVVGAILLGILTFFAFTRSDTTVLGAIVSRVSKILYFFMPYALLTFGPLTDIITQKLQFAPASAVGITSIFMNWIVSIFMNGGVQPPSLNELCEIPGLVGFSSNLVPQPMMATLSILAYIATYLSRSSITSGGLTFANQPIFIWPMWLLYGLVWLFYVATFASLKCSTMGSMIAGLFAPAVYGGVFGVLAFEFLAPANNLSSPGSASQPILGGAVSTTPTTGTCAAGSGEGEFICESFENGKKTTKVMTE